MTHEEIQITVVGVFAVLMCVSSSDYAGLSFNLTRSDDDKFKNPIAAACDWQSKHQKFCKDTNSRCDKDCCQCTCDYQTSTFDSSNMKCQTNNEFRKGKIFGNIIMTLSVFIPDKLRGSVNYLEITIGGPKIRGFFCVFFQYNLNLINHESKGPHRYGR